MPWNRLILAVYNAYFGYSGSIYYRMTENKEVLEAASKDVNNYFNSTNSSYSRFAASYAIIVTWDVPSRYPTNVNRNLFQVVVATNGNKTFGIFNYKKLFTTYATAGYSENLCNFGIIQNQSSQSVHLVSSSNVNIRGRHVLQLTNDYYFKPEYGVKFKKNNYNYYGRGLSMFTFS